MDNISKILLRQDSKANWENANTILGAGELGVAFDNSKVWGFKIGDGTTSWNDLPYYLGDTTSLLNRLAELEQDVTALNNEVNGTELTDGLVDNVQALNTQINGVDGIADTLGTLGNTVSSNTQDISTLNGQMSTVTGTTIPAITGSIAAEALARQNGDDAVNQAIVNLSNRIDSLNTLPTNPDTDGTYVLKCIVDQGEVTYEWVEEVVQQEEL